MMQTWKKMKKLHEQLKKYKKMSYLSGFEPETFELLGVFDNIWRFSTNFPYKKVFDKFSTFRHFDNSKTYEGLSNSYFYPPPIRS